MGDGDMGQVIADALPPVRQSRAIIATTPFPPVAAHAL